jgi:hypothetical protein
MVCLLRSPGVSDSPLLADYKVKQPVSVINEVAVSAVAASGIIHNVKVGFPKGDWVYETSPFLTDEVTTVDEHVQYIWVWRAVASDGAEEQMEKM